MLYEVTAHSTFSEDTQVDLKVGTSTSQRRPVLVVLEGAEVQQSWVLDRENLLLGRDAACAIPLRDPTASRRHARIWCSEPDEEGLPPTVRVEDLGSTNGTQVNGVRLEGAPRILREHDRIRIGATVLAFEFRDVLELEAEQRLRRQAMTDALTKVSNRGQFDREFAREFERCRRYGRPFTLVLVDLDHFKRVNDTWGHVVGDRVLGRVGELLREMVRESDTVARFGGEEFAIVLPETKVEGGYHLAERIRQRLQGLDVEAATSPVRVTASFGVAGLDPAFADPNDMLVAADRALYRAKDRGRNRTMVWRNARRVGGAEA